MRKFFLLLFLSNLLLLIAITSVSASEVEYYLTVDINPENKILYGKAEITPSTNIKVDVSNLVDVKFENAEISNPILNKLAMKNIDWKQVELKAGIKQTIEFQYPLTSFSANSDKDNVVLSGFWYPQINQLANYHLKVNLPEGFQVISEADKIESKSVDYKRVEYQFHFPHLLDNLTLAASKNYQHKYKVFQGIQVETWFMPGNAHLADNYIKHAIDYLDLYQKMLGPYPYKRFAMVESKSRNGYSMPSYTVLGSQVIALPFIVKSSLGHEILHQWFGNSIYVDHQHGNWCEGLTNYLADYFYAEKRGKGSEYRKGMLRTYASYVNTESSFPVREFISRKDKSSSSIGYGKVAMIFHQLRQYYGDKKFFLALRSFVKKNSFRITSWHDVQREFEAIDGEPLYEDFNAWLTRNDIANIGIAKAAKLELSQGKLWLDFSLQQNQSPYHLHVPLVLNFANGKKQTKILHFTETNQDFKIAVDEPPVSAFLDPDYQLIRHLSDEEKIPDLAWLMGKKAISDSIIIAVNDKNQAQYQPLIKGLGLENQKIIAHNKLTFEQIKNHSVIIAGYDNNLVQMLFAKQQQPDNGVDLIVKRNPYNDQQVIVLLSARDKEQVQQVATKLSHYGKYSQLSFNDGRLKSKQIAASNNGILLFEQMPTQAIKPSQIQSIDNIVANLGDKRVVLIGETHNRYEHHLNQLLFIKKLKDAGYQVAVGMEMFQQPYQQALDDYLAGKTKEAEFLTKSRYFDKWRYDYNLYKPIIDYVLSNKIPLIALNIEGDINREVSKTGIASLDEAKQKHLPSQLDFSNRDYRSDLKMVFQAHQQMQPLVEKSFNFFLQSQTLWDESMAQTANTFLQDNPQHVLVILAGNGHLRYRYGIPQRIQRLSGFTPLVIVQDEELDKDIADYVLITTPIEGASTPKIGVYLETAPVETAPVETAPLETAPLETAPLETASVETVSVEANSIDKKSSEMVIIKEVTKPSVASKSGLKKGDIIVQLDGKLLKSFADLKLALLYADINRVIEIKIKRGEKMLTKWLDFTPNKSEYEHFSYDQVHGKQNQKINNK